MTGYPVLSPWNIAAIQSKHGHNIDLTHFLQVVAQPANVSKFNVL